MHLPLPRGRAADRLLRAAVRVASARGAARALRGLRRLRHRRVLAREQTRMHAFAIVWRGDAQEMCTLTGNPSHAKHASSTQICECV
jgi:hypothetical protein